MDFTNNTIMDLEFFSGINWYLKGNINRYLFDLDQAA